MMAGYRSASRRSSRSTRSATTVQLIAKNVKYHGDKQARREARAVAQAFSDSLLASAPVVSQPHPERKSVLIEANALLLADIPAATGSRAHLPRSLCVRRAQLVDRQGARNAATTVTFDGVGALLAVRASRCRRARPRRARRRRAPPSTLPDVRSLFLGFHYNSRQAARRADAPARRRRAGRLLRDRIGSTSRPTCRACRRSATSIAGASRRRIPPRRCRSRSSRSSTGSTATIPEKVPRSRPRRHPRVEQGLRADRLQGRDPGRGPARRRRLRHGRRPARVGALV